MDASSSSTSRSPRIVSPHGSDDSVGDKRRRRSTRDIKRPKFDDELVEPSLPFKSPARRRVIDDCSVSPPPVQQRAVTPQPPAQTAAVAAAVVAKVEKVEPAVVAAAPSPVGANRSASSSTAVAAPAQGEQAPVRGNKRPALASTSSLDTEQKPKRRNLRTGSVAGEPQPCARPRPAKPAASSSARSGAKPTASAAQPAAAVHHVDVKPVAPPLPPPPPPPAVAPSVAAAHSAALEDMGRWTAEDDLALITAVMQVADLNKVYTGVNFSCRFTLNEIQNRWYNLLYNAQISKLAKEAMSRLPRETIARIRSETLFTKREEAILATIRSLSEPSVADFDALLQRNAGVFHDDRSGRSLYSHWVSMRRYKLLNDQRSAAPSHVPMTPNELSLAEIEAGLDGDPEPPRYDALQESEQAAVERRMVREMRAAESDLSRHFVLTEALTGVNPPEFDGETVAALRGRLVRYLVRNKEVTIGRRGKHSPVDIDLSAEGPALSISRRAASIKMRATGEFHMMNEGRRPFYVDGRAVMPGAKTVLYNDAVIEIDNIRLVFLVNHDIIDRIRRDAAQMMVA